MEDPLRAARAQVRSGDYDRYLCAQFAPLRARPGLMAVSAFALEVAQIPFRIREPAMGQLRVAWWREALDRIDAGVPSEHPVAAALSAVSERRRPLPVLTAVLDACDHGLRDPGDPTRASRKIAAATQRAWLAVLDVHDADSHAAAALVGEAWAIALAPDRDAGPDEGRHCLREAGERRPRRGALPALLLGAIARTALGRQALGRPPPGPLRRQTAVWAAALRGRY